LITQLAPVLEIPAATEDSLFPHRAPSLKRPKTNGPSQGFRMGSFKAVRQRSETVMNNETCALSRWQFSRLHKTCLVLAATIVLSTCAVAVDPGAVLGSDDYHYLTVATGSLKHWGFGHSRWPFTMLYSVTFSVFGVSGATILLSRLFCHTFAVLAVGLLAFRFGGFGSALIAVAVAAFCPPLLEWSTAGFLDALLAAFFALAVALLPAFRERRAHIAAVLFGCVAGLAICTKITGIVVFLILLLAWVTLRFRLLLFAYVAVGLAFIALLDTGYHTWRTGDPLARWHVLSQRSQSATYAPSNELYAHGTVDRVLFAYPRLLLMPVAGREYPLAFWPCLLLFASGLLITKGRLWKGTWLPCVGLLVSLYGISLFLTPKLQLASRVLPRYATVVWPFAIAIAASAVIEIAKSRPKTRWLLVCLIIGWIGLFNVWNWHRGRSCQLQRRVFYQTLERAASARENSVIVTDKRTARLLNHLRTTQDWPPARYLSYSEWAVSGAVPDGFVLLYFSYEDQPDVVADVLEYLEQDTASAAPVYVRRCYEESYSHLSRKDLLFGRRGPAKRLVTAFRAGTSRNLGGLDRRSSGRPAAATVGLRWPQKATGGALWQHRCAWVLAERSLLRSAVGLTQRQ